MRKRIIIRRDVRSSTLGIVLFSIAVISILLVSYLASVQSDRQETANYSRSIQADEIARGATEDVLSDLLSEIDAGSVVNPAVFEQEGVRIWEPVTNLAWMPARIGFPKSSYGNSAADLPLSLIRVSRAADTFYSAPPGYFGATRLPGRGFRGCRSNRRELF